MKRTFRKSHAAIKLLSLVLALAMTLGLMTALTPAFAEGGEYLYKHGFIKGASTTEMELKEGELLNREQLAILIAEVNGMSAEAAAFTGDADFADADQISGWAKPCVAFLAEKGLMIGKPEGFDPKGIVTEKELGVVLLRALGYEPKWETAGLTLMAMGFKAGSEPINRGDAFDQIWMAVSRPYAEDGSILGVKLGKLTEEELTSQEPLLSVKAATQFKIQYLSEGAKLVTDSFGNQLLLVPEGVKTPEGFEDAMVIKTPVKRIFMASTPHQSYILNIDKDYVNAIVGVTTPAEEWGIPEIKSRIETGKIKYVEKPYGAPMNIEEIVALKPDIVLFDGYDREGEMKIAEQLKEFGIPTAFVCEWTEPNRQAMIEWHKFFGAFFNADKKAEDLYEKIYHDYIETLHAAEDVKPEDRPVIGAANVFFGTVYSNGGQSSMASNIEKLGGTFATKDIEGNSVEISMEELIKTCKDADIFIYTSLPQYVGGLEGLKAAIPQITEFKAYKNNKIYIFDIAYFQNSALEHEKLLDLLYILHPELVPDHVLKHYKHFDVTGAGEAQGTTEASGTQEDSEAGEN